MEGKHLPMSSATLTEAASGILAAWETAGQVYYTDVNSKTMRVSEPISPKRQSEPKAPGRRGNKRGEHFWFGPRTQVGERVGAVGWRLLILMAKLYPRKIARMVCAWSLAAAFGGDE